MTMPSIPTIPYSLAYDAHRGSSFVPEKRAQQRQDEYRNLMQHDYDQLSKLARDDNEKAVLDSEFTRYASGYASYYRKGLMADSRTMSSMITGPSNFPTARNQKRLDIARRRWDELSSFRERALKAIRKAIRPDLGPIMTGQCNAVQLLQEQLDAAKKSQVVMKLANGLIRKYIDYDRGKKLATFKPGKTEEEFLAKMAELKIGPAMVKELLTPDWGMPGFASYQLSNNNANIRRIEGRIKSISALKEMDETEVKYEDGITVSECPQDARIRITFPGKPDKEVITSLKRNGFKWSPTNMAWQRGLNSGGRWAVAAVVEQFGWKKETQQ